MKTPQELEKEIADKKAELDYLERSLSHIRESCRHDWTPVIADHITHAGYTDPGDPPGTMGIDWRGPMWVPPETTLRWKRTCKKCAKVEHTSRTQDHVTKTPVF